MIIVFCASVGVGATSIVGSITTGNCRPGASSHDASGVSVTRKMCVAAFQDTCCVTFGLHTYPYGDQASLRALVMNGAGSTSTGGPPAPVRENATAPLLLRDGTSPPPTRTVNENEDASAGPARVMSSRRDCGVTWYPRLVPGTTAG
ncbi:MAG TPA: hypothetical protein VFV41_21775 [Streptosporangiaceae bacterium]|nr:hypothetical protein [Streptosporangiaceae bacterium]